MGNSPTVPSDAKRQEPIFGEDCEFVRIGMSQFSEFPRELPQEVMSALEREHLGEKAFIAAFEDHLCIMANREENSNCLWTANLENLRCIYLDKTTNLQFVFTVEDAVMHYVLIRLPKVNNNFTKVLSRGVEVKEIFPPDIIRKQTPPIEPKPDSPVCLANVFKIFFKIDKETKVFRDDGLYGSLDAWYNVNRKEAENKLVAIGLENGTYILRPSSFPKAIALSIRSVTNVEDFEKVSVEHYLILKTEENNYILSNSEKTFKTIEELLEHNKKKALISEPYPRRYKPPADFSQFELDRRCIKMVRELGSGSFGNVFLATWNKSIQVAVKTQLPRTDIASFVKEARTMHELSHPRIVRLLGICSKPENEPIYIITELMPKGALSEFLRSEAGHKLLLQDLIDIMSQICDGMTYLEARNVVHRDLRAANILVGQDNSVKVADFGLAKNPDESLGLPFFPVKWTAPEAVLLDKFSVKSDVWSFGVLVYEIVTYGDTPYPSMKELEVLCMITKGFRMPKPSKPDQPCPNELFEVMNECWHQEPEKRPTFAYLKDTFINWFV